MTSRQALFTFLPLKLYVCLEELQCSIYLQRLGGGWNHDAFAALQGDGIALVVGDGGLALQADENHETVEL